MFIVTEYAALKTSFAQIICRRKKMQKYPACRDNSLMSIRLSITKSAYFSYYDWHDYVYVQLSSIDIKPFKTGVLFMGYK